MVRKRFEESFEELRQQSNRLAATDRSPENFDEIVKQRVKLDRLRKRATRERKRIVTRHEPPATDVVHDSPHLSTFGKVAAGISVGLLVLLGFILFQTVREINTPFPLEILTVSQNLETDPSCSWQLEIVIRNDSDLEVEVDRIRTVVRRGPASTASASQRILAPREIPDENVGRTVAAAVPTGDTILAPGETGTVHWAYNPFLYESCPDLDEIGHGVLTVVLTNGARVHKDF